MFPRRVQPIWQLEFRGSPSLVRLAFLEQCSRSIISTVVPLAALEALGNKGSMSWAYAAGAVLAITVTLSLSIAERLVMRKWITTTGFTFFLTALAIFVVADGPIFALGIGLLASATSIFTVTLSLYIMESIASDELSVAESSRMLCAGVAWLIGPVGGIWLHDHIDINAPFIVSSLLALAALGYFWAIRLGGNPAVTAPTHRPGSPIHHIVRFFRQPAMRIAYAITLVRAMFWVAIFVYGSIYIVESGLPRWVGGVFLSSMAGLLFLAKGVARLARRWGTRAIIRLSFGLVAVSMVSLALIGQPRPIGLIAWAIGAVGASALDVLGNIPFMRSVGTEDRSAMTSVFSTWRDLSALVAPLIAALVLAVAPFWVFFAILAALSAATANYARGLAADL